MTYAISSALNRYESGTATRLSLRAAWMVDEHLERVRPAPHQPLAGRRAAASNPLARRFDERVELGEGRDRRTGAARRVDDDREGVGSVGGGDGEDGPGQWSRSCSPGVAATDGVRRAVVLRRGPQPPDCPRNLTVGRPVGDGRMPATSGRRSGRPGDESDASARARTRSRCSAHHRSWRVEALGAAGELPHHHEVGVAGRDPTLDERTGARAMGHRDEVEQLGPTGGVEPVGVGDQPQPGRPVGRLPAEDGVMSSAAIGMRWRASWARS